VEKRELSFEMQIRNKRGNARTVSPPAFLAGLTMNAMRDDRGWL
jgi:hypothetical protein